jgi:hypothetical protein
MKIAYTDNLGLNKANTARLETINGIIDTYRGMGYIMTLRQLYYQLVSRDIIANNLKEYQALSRLLTKGRMAGVVDWAAIEDRGRQPRLPYWCVDIADAIDDTHSGYRIDRMQGQEYYIEVWVEKDALSNIFSRVTNKYHIRLMVNKGYSSCSAMHDAYLRFQDEGRSGIILYFGDHDPSGKDMVRDIEARMREFGLRDFDIVNPALSMAQVRRYRLPENPAKITDSRAKKYIEQYGVHSWELDALEPPVLTGIIETSIAEYVDMKLYTEALTKEKKEKALLKQLVDQRPWELYEVDEDELEDSDDEDNNIDDE